jgi:hypothetical protein
MNKTHDDLEIYCPHLGMMLTFAYCRCSQSPLPCRNLVNCWENRMAVGTFLAEHFSPEELEHAFGGLPKTRLERIFDKIHELKGEPEPDREK